MAKDKDKVEKGEQVAYLLAFGQHYRATVDEVYDQENADGGLTVDLTYEGNQVPHVPYSRSLQQPNSYCRVDDPGWPGTLPKPEQAAITAAVVAERSRLAAEQHAASLMPNDPKLRKAAQDQAEALHAGESAPDVMSSRFAEEPEPESLDDRRARAGASSAADQTQAAKIDREAGLGTAEAADDTQAAKQERTAGAGKAKG